MLAYLSMLVKLWCVYFVGKIKPFVSDPDRRLWTECKGPVGRWQIEIIADAAVECVWMVVVVSWWARAAYLRWCAESLRLVQSWKIQFRFPITRWVRNDPSQSQALLLFNSRVYRFSDNRSKSLQNIIYTVDKRNLLHSILFYIYTILIFGSSVWGDWLNV